MSEPISYLCFIVKCVDYIVSMMWKSIDSESVLVHCVGYFINDSISSIVHLEEACSPELSR